MGVDHRRESHCADGGRQPPSFLQPMRRPRVEDVKGRNLVRGARHEELRARPMRRVERRREGGASSFHIKNPLRATEQQQRLRELVAVARHRRRITGPFGRDRHGRVGS